MSHYVQSYSRAFSALRATHGEERAMELVVGGNYIGQGQLNKALLVQLGLQPGHNVIDVGCGSGRLAFALKDYLQGRLIGTDILGEALDFAVKKTQRPDWRFIRTEDSVIPADDGWADCVCFFSVLTHLQDTDCYRFLQEAKRVARPGGLVVFSYLDWEVSWHWPVFENSVKDPNPHAVLNRFHTKAQLQIWAGMLGLAIERMTDGPEPWIELPEPVVFDDGRKRSGTVEFGQSICLLRVPAAGAVPAPPPTIAGVVTRLGLKHW
jgi:ubiquinone/menaquinone biosynthesis C-methylase UbiE